MQESTAEASSSQTPSPYWEGRGGTPDNDIVDKLPHEFPGGILPVVRSGGIPAFTEIHDICSYSKTDKQDYPQRQRNQELTLNSSMLYSK